MQVKHLTDSELIDAALLLNNSDIAIELALRLHAFTRDFDDHIVEADDKNDELESENDELQTEVQDLKRQLKEAQSNASTD
jgi:peptidoglycan hydrolase CwlO-like protein